MIELKKKTVEVIEGIEVNTSFDDDYGEFSVGIDSDGDLRITDGGGEIYFVQKKDIAEFMAALNSLTSGK